MGGGTLSLNEFKHNINLHNLTLLRTNYHSTPLQLPITTSLSSQMPHSKFHTLLTATTLVLLLLALLQCTHAAPQRILESDITDLELTASKRAKCRRVCPAPPQIQCNPNLGETCKKKHLITHAHCVNEGTDPKGRVRWRCSHNADIKKVKVSQVRISCEGWGSADDEYVLDGSCAMEYGLRWVNGPSDGGIKSYWPLFVLAAILSPCLVCMCLLCLCCMICMPRPRRDRGTGGYFRTDDNVYGGDPGFGPPPPMAYGTRR